jgi:hypothetical protein
MMQVQGQNRSFPRTKRLVKRRLADRLEIDAARQLILADRVQRPVAYERESRAFPSTRNSVRMFKIARPYSSNTCRYSPNPCHFRSYVPTIDGKQTGNRNFLYHDRYDEVWNSDRSYSSRTHRRSHERRFLVQGRLNGNISLTEIPQRYPSISTAQVSSTYSLVQLDDLARARHLMRG